MKFRKCLHIGINYHDHSSGRLYGCVNDCRRWIEYASENHEVVERRVFVDEPDAAIKAAVPEGYIYPNRREIEDGFRWVVSDLEAGDNILVTYSGHGAYTRDRDGDEEDGYDETLCPSDYATAGEITDDELREIFVDRVPAGVTVYAVPFDCCHSGTVLDLPTVFKVETPSSYSYGNTPYSPQPYTPPQPQYYFDHYSGMWYLFDGYSFYPLRSSRGLPQSCLGGLVPRGGYIPAQRSRGFDRFFNKFMSGLDKVQTTLHTINSTVQTVGQVANQFQQMQQMFSSRGRRVARGAEARKVLRTREKITRNGVTAEILDYDAPPARFICFSGCRDDQTSADAREETDEGMLSVGACSNALLNALERSRGAATIGEVLKDVRSQLSGKYEQVVQATASGFSSDDVLEF